MDTRAFQIGVVGVRISADTPWFLDEYTALYEPFRVCGVGHPALEIVVFSQRKKPWTRAEFGVRCAGRQSLAGRDRRAVLPEIEAAINRLVVARESTFVQLHAGALVRDGQAVLLPADSGTGKSSLAAGLIARGWQYLSDEFALIEPVHGWAYPFPKALCIKDSGVDLVRELGWQGELAGPYYFRGKHRRFYLPPWRRGMHLLAGATPIHWMFYLSRKPGAAAQLYRPTRAEAAVYAYRTGLNTLGHGRRGLETVVKLVRDCCVYQLNVGSIEDTVDLLEKALHDGAEDMALEPRRDHRHERVPA